jgi:signal peptide peptidase SppA
LSVLKTITRRYLDRPQLMEPSAFKDIASLLDMEHGRDALQSYFKPLSSEEKTKAKMVDPFYSGYRFDVDGTEVESPEEYGVIKIEGPLTYAPEMRMCAPDTCNYQELVKTVQAIADTGKKRIIMVHNSPGGEAYNAMALASEVRKIADDNNIELIGYVDGMSASASYIWLSICNEVIANGDSSIGSIGVVISLLNNSEALKKAGYKRTFITAGASKVPFDKDGEFKEDFIQELQTSVDELYENFIDHVATYRKDMSKDTIRNTEAKVFRAKDALELGLIDNIMTNSQFKEKYLTGGSNSLSPTKTNSKDKKRLSMSDKDQTIDIAAFEAMKEKLAQFEAQEQARELSAKKESITKSLESATFLSNMETVVSTLMSADEATASLINTIISDATASLATQKETLTAEFDSVKEELNTTIASLTADKETLTQEKENLKAEFAKPDAIRGEEEENNLQELPHKEKLARAVAAAKAKKQA